MRPRSHVIYGGAGAAALYPVLGSGSLWFWGASVLIDIDHYLDFVYHNRFTDLGFNNMFRYHAVLNKWWAKPEFLSLEPLHTVEFVAPMAFLTWWTGSGVLLAITLGFVLHIMLDVISLCMAGAPFIRAHSCVEYFIRKHLMARRGLNPTDLYDRAVEMVRQQ